MQTIIALATAFALFLYSTWIQEGVHDTWARFQHGAAREPDATTCVQAKELPLGTVPPGASLVYAIELVSLEKVRSGAYAGALLVLKHRYCTLRPASTNEQTTYSSQLCSLRVVARSVA